MPISLKDIANQIGVEPLAVDGKISLEETARGAGVQGEVAGAKTIAEEAIKEKGFVEDALGDIGGFFRGAKESFVRRGEGIVEAIQKGGRGEFNPLVAGIVTTGEVAGAVGDIAGEAFLGLGKLLMSESAEQEIKDSFQNFIQESGASEAIQKGYEGWQEFKKNNPQIAESIEGVANIADAFLEISGVGLTGKGVRKGVEAGVEAGLRTGEKIFETGKNKLFGKVVDQVDVANVDNLIKKSDDLLKEAPRETAEALRRGAEETAPSVNLLEKWAGVRPDIKKRIAGKQDQLKTYFDIAHASNLDDKLPTVYDFANLQVKRAEQGIRNELDDVGSAIGQIRRKLATTRVDIEKIDNVIKSFDEELGKLNLTVDARGNVIQQSGRAKAVGAGEIRVLTELRNNIGIIKQNPIVDNIIDNRIIFDDRINFAKRAGDVSGVVDPISRRIRKELADMNAEAVGKTNADDLARYSLAKDAQKQLESYTTRKAGSEFLLRLVLSGRGREAREMIELVKSITGIDLMDDATMLQIAVELIGNARTKNLFRQEIEKAGLDVAKVLSGKGGAIATLFEKTKDILIKEEEIFLKAAK